MVLLVIAVRFIFQVKCLNDSFFMQMIPRTDQRSGCILSFVLLFPVLSGKNNLFEAKRSMEIDKRKFESTDSRK